MMIALILWAGVVLLGVLLFRRSGRVGIEKGTSFAIKQAKSLAIRLPAALLAAAFLVQVIPTEAMAAFLGPESGLSGIVIASIVGGLLPGGPMISFPLALVIWQSGAGAAQTVALLAGWSVFAVHRVLAFEAPMMGWRFTALRLVACFFLPPLAGLLAALVIGVIETVEAPVAVMF